MPIAPPALLVRRLAAQDAAAFQSLRLHALQESPTAFGAHLEDERRYTLDIIAGWIAPADPAGGGGIGAFDGENLVGMACVRRAAGRKEAHKASLVSVYVAPGHRGAGVASRLIRAAIELARGMDGVRRINLSVTVGNQAALALYRRLGFAIYGREIEALWVDGAYYDEHLMTLALETRGLAYAAVDEGDFDALADLRVAAMRDSLEQIGRFDPERARQRLRATYAPRDTLAILRDGQRIGFYTLRRDDGALKLDHLYIAPGHQGAGVGAAVLRRVFERADALGLPVRVGALRDSASNRFYRRHGFVETSQDAWDIYYERAPRGSDG
ncbi:N-acetyltransferase domain-containing protein [Bordetella sputigena]|uniref:GNAT family N-acetyltransferase n=1 Tax=Bordetella sputigena TaxID=1416810 RepID=UPI0039F0AFA6